MTTKGNVGSVLTNCSIYAHSAFMDEMIQCYSIDPLYGCNLFNEVDMAFYKEEALSRKHRRRINYDLIVDDAIRLVNREINARYSRSMNK